MLHLFIIWNNLIRVDCHGSKEVPKGTCHAKLKAAGINKPKRCITKRADILQNPCESARFNYDTRDRILNRSCLLEKGWQAKRKGCKVPMAGLFQHICPLR